MTHVAEFTVPATALPGGHALVEMSEMSIEVERVVPTGTATLPFIWVWGEQVDQFVGQLEEEPDLDDVRILDRVRNGALVRTRWTPHADLIAGIKSLEVTIVSAIGTGGGWWFTVRTSDREAFNRFQTLFRDQGIPVELVRIYDVDQLVDGAGGGLTGEQRETLELAYREGYFATPRQTSLRRLGDDLDISSRAVSGRLRRGIRNLIERQLPSEREGRFEE